jgi:hypothetical protein
MTIHLTNIITLSKSLAIKREKDEDSEITRAQLRFTDLFVSREQVNALCGMRAGWCETSFFDELGAPFGGWSLALTDGEWTLAGAIEGPGEDSLRVTEATLSDVELTFTTLGAVASGEITWTVRGDEVGDAEPLLGRECRADWRLTDGGQRDMLRERAA